MRERPRQSRLELHTLVQVQCRCSVNNVAFCNRCYLSLTDVTNKESIADLVSFTAEEFGRIDGIVNNAGTHNGMGLVDCEEDDFTGLIDLNLTSMFRLSKSALPHMQNAGGSIVNMSSGVGLVGQQDSVAYAASKGGALSMTKTLAVELGRYNIRVNAICPG